MMRRVFEHLGRDDGDSEDNYGCMECGHVLGPVSSGYRANALIFDEPAGSGQPAGFVTKGSDFLLRHYACPNCATLFEVEMMPASNVAVAG